MHAPVFTVALDMTHSGAREDLRAVLVRVRQIVHQRSVLRAVIAAAGAVSAQGAARLSNAEGIHLIPEVDRNRRPAEGLFHGLGRHLQRLQLIQRRKIIRVGFGIEHPQCAPGVLLERRFAVSELLGPERALVFRSERALELARIHFQGHISIDKRGSAEPAAHQRPHIVVHVHVEHAVRAAQFSAAGIDLHFGRCLCHAIGVLAGPDLAATLQHAYALAGTREARGGDRGAVTRTYDHDRIFGPELGQRPRQGLHPWRGTHRRASIAMLSLSSNPACNSSAMPASMENASQALA